MNDIGPMDENGEPIGGEALLLLNVELQYRFTDFFRGFVFYDRGNVYGSNDEMGNTTENLLRHCRNAARCWHGHSLLFANGANDTSIWIQTRPERRRDPKRIPLYHRRSFLSR